VEVKQKKRGILEKIGRDWKLYLEFGKKKKFMTLVFYLG
jgi:hypothetical protein